MYWVHHGKRRYYRVHIARDLFDELTVITCWGSLDSHRGGYRTLRLTSQEDLHRKLRAIAARRRQHGYERLH
jgi:hypothetical protein